MFQKFAIFIDLSDKNGFEFYKKTIFYFLKKIPSLIILDISKICTRKNIKFNNIKNLFQPNNIWQLKKFLSDKNLIIMYCLNFDLKYFFIHFVVSLSGVKKFIISNIGYNPENFNYFKKNFIQKIKIFFIFRFKYYLFRILIFINIFPKIDYFFESSKYIINSINNGLSKKINNLIPFINFSFYKKVIQINSKFFSPNIKKIKSEKYIVFIDGMILDHKDVIYRQGTTPYNIRQKYYEYINTLLLNLKKNYKKKIIICLHPKNFISTKKKDFKNFKCVKFQTEKYITNAFLVLFHEGSSIVQAILLKKKIISLQGAVLGDYINQRCKLYSDALGLKVIKLDDVKNKSKINISIKQLQRIAKYKYNKYINDNLVQDQSLTGLDQVISYIKQIK